MGNATSKYWSAYMQTPAYAYSIAKKPKLQVNKRIARIIKKPWVFRKYIGAAMYWQIEGMSGFYSKVNSNRIPPGSVLAYDPSISQLHHFMPVGLFELESAFERAVAQASDKKVFDTTPYVMPSSWPSPFRVNSSFFSGQVYGVAVGGK